MKSLYHLSIVISKTTENLFQRHNLVTAFPKERALPLIGAASLPFFSFLPFFFPSFPPSFFPFLFFFRRKEVTRLSIDPT